MKIEEKILSRFCELIDRANKIKITKQETPFGGDCSYIDDDTNWEKLITNSFSLIENVFEVNSSYYKECTKILNGNREDPETLYKLKGIVEAAKEDYETGFTKIKEQIAGEIFSDFIILAKETLNEGSKDVAAVLACAALEDALKRYAKKEDVTILEKATMANVIDALKAKGLIGGAKSKILPAYAKIRNFAMHANWNKIDEASVSGIIAFVEQFLLENFLRRKND